MVQHRTLFFSLAYLALCAAAIFSSTGVSTRTHLHGGLSFFAGRERRCPLPKQKMVTGFRIARQPLTKVSFAKITA